MEIIYRIVIYYRNDNMHKSVDPLRWEKNRQQNKRQYILKEEFKLALKELKYNKATGILDISEEMLSAIEGQGKKAFLNNRKCI